MRVINFLAKSTVVALFGLTALIVFGGQQSNIEKVKERSARKEAVQSTLADSWSVDVEHGQVLFNGSVTNVTSKPIKNLFLRCSLHAESNVNVGTLDYQHYIVLMPGETVEYKGHPMGATHPQAASVMCRLVRYDEA